MKRAFHRNRQAPAIIVGSDIPGIDGKALAAAFRQLGRRRAIFGTAPDGGFWLVGLAGGRPVPRTLFGKVRWSSRDALADSLQSLPGNWSVGFLLEKDDIDDGAAFRAWRLKGGRP